MLRPKTEVPMKHIAAGAFVGLVLLVCALEQPFMSILLMGMTAKVSLLDVFSSLKFDWSSLLWAFLLFTFVCPAVMLSQIIAAGWFRWRPGRHGAELYRVCHRFCMVDVLLLGIAVSLVRLTQMSEVGIYGGFYCGVAFAVVLIACGIKCPPSRIWDLVCAQDIEATAGQRGIDQGIYVCRHCEMAFKAHREGERCPRCQRRVYSRSHQWLQKDMALLITAVALFLPANYYPMMFTNYLGSASGSNIAEGVVQLWEGGSHLVAAVIAVASLMIPTCKIVVLAALILIVLFRKRIHRMLLSRVYRVIDFIGKWSMVDVFVVVLMTVIVQLENMINAWPGTGVIFFCSVVLTTLYAAECFDERLIWDKAH